MSKIRLTSPTFDASAQTIVHPSFSDVGLAGIQLITNVTDGVIIYNFADATKGGTLATDTLTLEYDTTSMSDTDDLMILVEDGLQQTVTAELSATDNAVLDAIEADTTTIASSVYTEGATDASITGVPALMEIAGNTLHPLQGQVANGGYGLTTIIPGHVSTDNSTTSVLAGGAVFTGAWEEVTNHGIIVITLKASHASATDGLSVQFSTDGTNIDNTDEFTVAAATGKTFSFQAAAKYFRVVYTNGATLQTYFRLQTILKPSYAKPSSHRVSDSLSLQDDAELVKAVIAGETTAGGGAFVNVKVTPSGAITGAFQLNDGTDTALVTAAGELNVLATAQPGVDVGDVTVNNAAGASAVNIQDGGNSITVDAPVGTPAFVRLSDGAAAITTLPVSLATVPSHAVTNAGTFAVQVDGSALTSLQLLDDTVFADDAAFTLGTSKGSVMEGVAVNMDGTDPTAVSAEGDAAAVRTDPNRILLVNQPHPRFFHISADYASAQTNVSVKAAPGASLSIYITDIVLSNGATAGNITLLDGSGGTVLFEIYPAVNGGATMSLRNPIKLTANTALCLTSTTVTTHSIFVSGYIAA